MEKYRIIQGGARVLHARILTPWRRGVVASWRELGNHDMIAIIDYEAGNLTSVHRALQRVGCTEAVITADPAQVDAADAVIFPGVGAAGSCMASLRARGLDAALRRSFGRKPLLAICVGMQLLFEWSEEDGGVECLGLLSGSVVRLRPADPALKVPHMGWNAVDFHDEPLADTLPDRHLYFVHSFHCLPGPGVAINATCDFGGTVVAGVRHGPTTAFQCHPEKSGAAGMALLSAWLRGLPRRHCP